MIIGNLPEFSQLAKRRARIPTELSFNSKDHHFNYAFSWLLGQEGVYPIYIISWGLKLQDSQKNPWKGIPWINTNTRAR